MRDGDGFAFIMSALARRGYDFEDIIFSYPHPCQPSPREPEPKLIAFDDSFFRPSDLILLTTRPPMDDREFGDKKGIPRSFTTLEDKLFKALRIYLRKCARSQIWLAEGALGISHEIDKRESITLRQNGGARVMGYRSQVSNEYTGFEGLHSPTVAFLIYLEHAWPGGPALMAAFGVGATETLVWCWLLAKKYPDLLCTTPFVMAEIQTARYDRPTSMIFAGAWNVKILGSAKPLHNSCRVAGVSVAPTRLISPDTPEA
jgi:hypothetical protein